jgi:hypothetical protein
LGRYDLTIETSSTIYGRTSVVNGSDVGDNNWCYDGNTMTYSTGIARLKKKIYKQALLATSILIMNRDQITK